MLLAVQSSLLCRWTQRHQILLWTVPDWVHCNYCDKHDQLGGETNVQRQLEVANPDISMHSQVFWIWLVCTDPETNLVAVNGMLSQAGQFFEPPRHSKISTWHRRFILTTGIQDQAIVNMANWQHSEKFGTNGLSVCHSSITQVQMSQWMSILAALSSICQTSHLKMA